MSQTIDLALASLVSGQSSGYVVEDIYVKGGYRVVTVDPAIWNAANNDATDQEYQSALADEAGADGSIKLGCLVFDTTSSRNFRCTAAPPNAVTFIEAFANNGDVDTTAFVQRSELPQDANGAIDIASEATLQEALLSSVRVTQAQTPGDSLTVNLAIQPEDLGPLNPPFRWRVLADPDPSTQTQTQIALAYNFTATDPFTA